MDNCKEFREFLRNMLYVRTGHSLLFSGSSVELPIQYVITNVTDVDIMHIITDICALPVNVLASDNFQGKTLVINTESTHPGYARLIWPDCKRLYYKPTARSRYSHANGPACTRMANKRHFENNIVHETLDNFQCLRIYGRLLKLKLDLVFAIYCPCWPTEATEWKARERQNAWPPVEVIDKIVASGCHFVAKPHHSNPNDHTQWRYSFSQAEVILIHSWTDVQKYIYHILRLIKDEVVEACGGSDGTIICTYFFKTLMFWECERKPKMFWEDGNVEASVSELLCIMIEWLIDGCCPNYFIPKCNMLIASPERVDFSKEIQLLLDYALSDITKITARWQRAYPTYVIGPMQVALPEKVILQIKLIQIRNYYLNPLDHDIRYSLLKQLPGENSLLWRQTSDLHKGILSHLQIMKTRCPVRRCLQKRVALDLFMSSLVEMGDECSKVFLSIGESIYEWVHSGGMHNDFCKVHVSGNYRQSPLDTPVQGNFSTNRQRFPCYSRHEQVGSEYGDGVNVIKSSVTFYDLNASIKGLLEHFFATGCLYITSATHIISSAYLANFYYTALQDYKKAYAVCDTVGLMMTGPWNLEEELPLLITNELSLIFDENVQTVLGFMTLHQFIIFSLPVSVLVRVRPSNFLNYLKIQCKIREGLDVPEMHEYLNQNNAFDEWRDASDCLSAVFMLAVLRASCCQLS